MGSLEAPPILDPLKKNREGRIGHYQWHGIQAILVPTCFQNFISGKGEYIYFCYVVENCRMPPFEGNSKVHISKFSTVHLATLTVLGIMLLYSDVSIFFFFFFWLPARSP